MVVKCSCGDTFNCEKSNIVCPECSTGYDFDELQYVIKHHAGGYNIEYKVKEPQHPKKIQ